MRDACESRDGVGVCGSHCVCCPSRAPTEGLNDVIDAFGVTTGLRRRGRDGEHLLCGVGGKRNEGTVEAKDDEREGGSFNDAGASCASTNGGKADEHPLGACPD